MKYLISVNNPSTFSAPLSHLYNHTCCQESECVTRGWASPRPPPTSVSLNPSRRSSPGESARMRSQQLLLPFWNASRTRVVRSPTSALERDSILNLVHLAERDPVWVCGRARSYRIKIHSVTLLCKNILAEPQLMPRKVFKMVMGCC